MPSDEKNEKNRKDEKSPSHPSPTSHSSHPSHSEARIIPPRGDPRTLLSFQKAEVIYDLTFRWTRKYLAKGDRTIDQMVQAARSGSANILEGSKAGRTSKETEIKLTNVARASLDELLRDYTAYLRVRDHRQWDKDSKEALYVRRYGCKTPQTFELYRKFFETRPPEIIANIAICLIHQTHYLLDRQLLSLAKDFVEQGGLREQMTRARLHHRNRPQPP